MTTSSTPLPDSLRERLLKMLQLAQRGVGGERVNAEVSLDKLLAKHGLTRAALEEMDGVPTRETVWYTVAVADRALFIGLVYRLFGKRAVWIYRGKSQKRGADFSAAERVTFDLAWDVYKRAWHRVRDDVETAFIRKHRLFDPNAEPRYIEDLTDEERADFARQQKLAKSLDDVAAPGTKRLNGHR